MALEKTLILLRPSALSRGLAGEILSVFYKKVLRICGLKMMLPDENISDGHYSHLAGKSFFRRARDPACRVSMSEECRSSVGCGHSFRVKWMQSSSVVCSEHLSHELSGVYRACAWFSWGRSDKVEYGSSASTSSSIGNRVCYPNYMLLTIFNFLIIFYCYVLLTVEFTLPVGPLSSDRQK